MLFFSHLAESDAGLFTPRKFAILRTAEARIRYLQRGCLHDEDIPERSHRNTILGIQGNLQEVINQSIICLSMLIRLLTRMLSCAQFISLLFFVKMEETNHLIIL